MPFDRAGAVVIMIGAVLFLVTAAGIGMLAYRAAGTATGVAP